MGRKSARDIENCLTLQEQPEDLEPRTLDLGFPLASQSTIGHGPRRRGHLITDYHGLVVVQNRTT